MDLNVIKQRLESLNKQNTKNSGGSSKNLSLLETFSR